MTGNREHTAAFLTCPINPLSEITTHGAPGIPLLKVRSFNQVPSGTTTYPGFQGYQWLLELLICLKTCLLSCGSSGGRNSTLSFHPHGPMSHKVQGVQHWKEQNQLWEKKKKKPHTVPCPPNFSGPMVVYRDVGILSDIFWGRINLCKQSEGPRGHNEEWSSHLQRLHTVFVFTFYCHSNLWTLADGIGTLKLPQNYVEGNRGACFKSS